MKYPVRLLSILLILLMLIILTATISPTLAAPKPDNGEPPITSPNSSDLARGEQQEVPTPGSPQSAINSNGEPEIVPGKVSVVSELELTPERAALNASEQFKFISANGFTPYDSTMSYGYAGGGCMYRSGGARFSEYSLQLPQGAEIDYMRIYFYDNDPVNDAGATLLTFDGYGNYTELATAISSGVSTVHTSAGSGFFSHFVDNLNEAVSIRLSYDEAATQNLAICGVRIRYQYSISTVYLPLIDR